MGYLLTFAIVTLVFGLILLFTPNFLMRLGDICNRVILYLDNLLAPFKVWVGLILLVAGAWILYVVIRYPEITNLDAVWVISLAFGLLYLFFPNWLSWLSQVSNKIIFSTDDVVIGARKIVGVVLLIVSIYIFYGAYAVT
ncbi:MAG: hypothetical protein ABIH22_02270 [Candidatus Margulisiibacteriota bacterium]